ncbi:MAG TPA: hypothetical protein VEW07_07860 [Solirubrobacterales bacterium]|nr:hypothetical protein [Solirubrobacterales bacterium]
MRIQVLMAFIAAAGALLVGCGGSDDSTETLTTSSLSKAQWIKRAGAVCLNESVPILGRVNAYEEKHRAKTPRANEVVAGEAIRREVPPIMTDLIEELRALGAPEGDEEQVEAFLLTMEEDTQGIEDGPPLSSLVELTPKYADSGSLARQYGLLECAFG